MWFGLLAMVASHAEEPRPPRPSDSELLEAVISESPRGRVLSVGFSDAPRDGGRIGCGLIDIDGVVEPFSTLTAWRGPPTVTVRLVGQPASPVKPPHWSISAVVPTRTESDQDTETSRSARNQDALQRKLALMVCRDLQPPEGSVWTTELEPHPDPARDAEIKRLSKRTTDAFFGDRD